MKKYILLSGIAIMILAMNSCKQPDSGITHITINADLQAAFYYKTGTYWIYRDSISGRIDSFAVRSTELTNSKPANNSIIDGISIYITEYNGGSTADTSLWIINLASNYEELFWFKSRFGYEYFDFDPAFNYPFVVGVPTIIGGEPGDDLPYLTDIYPTFTINGNNFTTVAKTNHEYKYNSTINYNDWFYVNADVGYIKMDINDYYDNIFWAWELLRWHIVK